MDLQILAKYDVPAPRYTSYPTVPYWDKTPTAAEWFDSISASLQPNDSNWSIYIHVPFCESLCTYCGCTQTITKNHDKEKPYLDLVLQEWDLYSKNASILKDRKLKGLHIGGGTPTFLSAPHLIEMLKPIMDSVEIDHANFEGAVEVDPRRTSVEQLQALYDLGFNRVSLGVQDFNLEVQRLVNRIQPFEMTEKICQAARKIGFHSVNFDLIYGLPLQTLDRMKVTIEQTVRLKPDRIALYSLAVVPWIKPAQRLFKDEDLPLPPEKRQLYEYAREALLTAGYLEIGMDHFALPEDSMSVAFKNGTLHRNFMGYTTSHSDVLIGLGPSAISESKSCFHQNLKNLNDYSASIIQKKLPTLRGHVLTPEDIELRHLITQFMVHSEVEIKDPARRQDLNEYLSEMIQDHLVELTENKLILRPEGRPFLRNACMALDARLRNHKPDAKVFSQSI